MLSLVTALSFCPPVADFGRLAPELTRDARRLTALEHFTKVGLVGVGDGVRDGIPLSDAILGVRIIGETGAGTGEEAG